MQEGSQTLKRLQVSGPVAEAQREGRPLVALESSVFAQGLPFPRNLEVAQGISEAVAESGAEPVVIFLRQGRICYGASPQELEELCRGGDALKVGCGDIPGVLASGRLGATTVSGTLVAADLLKLPVFATGGIGGVHRGWAAHPDISADLLQLSRSRCLTVCSGMKSVLDVPATLEALEALGIPLILSGTDCFPEFYCAGETRVGTRLDEVDAIAEAQRESLALLGRAILVCQRCPNPLPREEVRAWVEEGLSCCPLGGKGVTPHLLSFLARASQGRTLPVNCELLVENARLAGRLAAVLARQV